MIWILIYQFYYVLIETVQTKTRKLLSITSCCFRLPLSEYISLFRFSLSFETQPIKSKIKTTRILIADAHLLSWNYKIYLNPESFRSSGNQESSLAKCASHPNISNWSWNRLKTTKFSYSAERAIWPSPFAIYYFSWRRPPLSWPPASRRRLRRRTSNSSSRNTPTVELTNE